MQQSETASPAERQVSRPAISRAIYGLVTVLAVLSLMAAHPPAALQGALTLFGTTLAVAILEVYAETIAGMLAHKRSLSFIELREVWQDASPVLIGAQAPTVVLLLSAVGLFPVEQAITIAQVISLILLFGYGWRVGQILHAGWMRSLISAVIVLVAGAFIVGIKAAFH